MATDGPEHWFEPIAEHLGRAYLRYSFTKGTAQEVGFLVEELGLGPGMRLLDVGCGPGRHAHALAGQGVEVVGVDISQRFVDLAAEAAPPGATFVRADARALAFDAEFDAAISLCQGAFGLVGPGADEEVLAGIGRALRPGGLAAVSAFSSYFSVRYQATAEGGATFDAATATASEVTEVRDEAGARLAVDLHTTCYTPRELHLLAERAGLDPVAGWSVEPGAYRRDPPTVESPEFLLIARRPG